jgi:hypothetical protein
MVEVKIACPICSQKGILNIDVELICSKLSGLYSVNVDKNFTCEHSYVAYIDQNYVVRDYFDSDYNIELPKIVAEKQTDDNLEDLAMSFDLDLIKLNITANILTIFFKSIISKKSIVFIRDSYTYHNSIIPFFSAINKNLFDFEINIIDEETYKNSKSKLKKKIVLNCSTIINNPHKFIALKKIKVEKQIINAFLVKMDVLTGLRILKNHITKSYDLAVHICDYVKNQDNVKSIYAKNITDFLESTHGVVISTQYLDYLIEIVNHYFEIPLKLSMPYYTGVF